MGQEERTEKFAVIEEMYVGESTEKLKERKQTDLESKRGWSGRGNGSKGWVWRCWEACCKMLQALLSASVMGYHLGKYKDKENVNCFCFLSWLH